MSLAIHNEKALCAPASLRRGIAKARFHYPLLFQPIKRSVESTRRGLALRALFDLATNRDTVGVLAQTQDGKHYDLLELTQRRQRFHNKNYIVVFMRARMSREILQVKSAAGRPLPAEQKENLEPDSRYLIEQLQSTP